MKQPPTVPMLGQLRSFSNLLFSCNYQCQVTGLKDTPATPVADKLTGILWLNCGDILSPQWVTSRSFSSYYLGFSLLLFFFAVTPPRPQTPSPSTLTSSSSYTTANRTLLCCFIIAVALEWLSRVHSGIVPATQCPELG